MTKVPKSCATCRLLADCKFVTEKMIEKGESCGDWKPVSEAQLDARNAIMRDLGPGALRYEVHHLNQKRIKAVKSRRRKRHV